MAESGAASRRFGCPSCGGGLRYDIPSGKMICDRCGSLTALEALPAEPAGDTLEVTEFHCPQCGAAVYSTDTEVTSFCSFCGSDVVLTGKLARTKRPAKIVPFTVTREECEAAYRNHLKRYLLAPGDLKKAETLSHFRPVYVPFWSYTVHSEGFARLEGKKSYTRGNTRYDDTYDLTMDAEIRQQGILYDASSAFEDETAAMLQHTAEGAKPFHPAHLSGFYAQGADVPAETYEKEAAASAVRFFMERVKEETKMDSVEMRGSISENFGLPNARYRAEQVMMPVWLLAHRQGQRVVYTAVNGESGEVVCDVPVSNARVAGVTLGLAVAVFLLLSRLLTLRPEWLMAFCALICLVIQYLFSGAQKRLFRRRTRADEPDFEKGEQAFAGPAQARLKRKKDGIAAGGGAVSDAFGKLRGIGTAAIILLLYLVFSNLPKLLSRMGTTADRRMLVLGVMLVTLVIMIVHTLRRVRAEGRGPMWPRILSLAACIAGFAAMALGRVEDMIYYVCAAAMLAASAVELVIINRAHNEYASRPVPFFDREGDEA